MKKLGCSIFFSLVFVLCFAQQKKDTITFKESKWAIDFSIAPNYSYYSNFYDYQQYYAESGGPYYGWDAGLSLQYKPNKTISFFLGLNYDSYRYRSSAIDTLNPNYWGDPKLYEARNHTQNNYYNLRIGTNVCFFHHDDLSFFCGFGVSYGKVMYSTYFKSDLTGQIGLLPDYINLSSIYYAFATKLNLGISYEFSKKIVLNIEPGFTYMFNNNSRVGTGYYSQPGNLGTPIYLGRVLGYNTYSFDIAISLQYNL